MLVHRGRILVIGQYITHNKPDIICIICKFTLCQFSGSSDRLRDGIMAKAV